MALSIGRLRHAVALLLILALLTACSATPSAESEIQTIRLGYIPIIIFAPLYVGIERGYFAEENIEIELTTIQSTNDAVIQLAAGNFEVIFAGGNAGVFNALEQGLDFTIIAPMHSESPPVATPLVTGADRDDIQSAADLAGKRVAVNGIGAAIEYWVDQALAQEGLSIEDVELTAMRFPDMPAALANGSLDAAVITEPLVTINEDQGLVKVLAEDFINGFTATYVLTNAPWLEANPEAARGFMRAYLRACRDLQGDYMNEEIAQIIEEYTQVPAAVVMRSPLAGYDPDGEVPIDDLETLQAFFMERGSLEYDELLDVNQFVNTEIATEVAAELDSAE
ncbi:MAG: ABC transporter substrate-binding protein [Chloroflexaceae bacterium]